MFTILTFMVQSNFWHYHVLATAAVSFDAGANFVRGIEPSYVAGHIVPYIFDFLSSAISSTTLNLRG